MTMMQHARLLIPATLVLMLCTTPAGKAATSYTFTTFDAPGASQSTYPQGINDGGQIVGEYLDSSSHYHGFLLSGGNFSTIDYPGAINTATYGINNLGQIVGAYADSSGQYHGFLATILDTTPPIVSNVQVAPDPVAINTPSSLTATIDDSTTGGSNIASAQYNIDGGQFFPMQATDGDFNQVAENVTVSVPAFAAAGVYNLCVTGTDSAGNTSGPSCIPLPVYDPTGGFVTGGGSIFSPAGKDLVNTSAAGQATFGFVSKYLKGSNTPSGNLEFHFQAGNLHFQSTSMDWLVVTGQPRAQFHGTGTINGANVCQFAVDAWAGSFPSTNGPLDAFGIKIYSCNSGGDSNGNRYSIDATPLSGGRIIVHQ